MMVLNKSFMLMIQILLVVAAVVILVFINPFNIFSSRKLTTTETTTIVESMQSIGQLISAEYYGEVIQSSTENVVDSVNHLGDSIKREIRMLETEFNKAIKLIYAANNNVKNARRMWDAFSPYNTNLSKRAQYHNLFTLYEQTPEIKAINGLLGQDRPEILFYLYERIKQNKGEFLIPQEFLEEHVAKNYELDRSELKTLERNKLVLLGRGWVKAGIDFKTFRDIDLKYIQSEGRILLMRHHPKILTSTINPWFIPKEKIFGFEYIKIGRNYKRGSDERGQLERVQKLKEECLAALEQQAIQANIIGSAKENAEQSLSSFFSLLLDTQVTVRIFGHPLDAYHEEFVRVDKKITADEIPSLDSLISVFIDTAFYETVSFARNVKALKFEPLGAGAKVDSADWSTQAMYLKVVYDSVRTPDETKWLKARLSAAGNNAYLYYMLFVEPERLDTIMNKKASVTIDTIIKEITKDTTVLKGFNRYRKANEKALHEALLKNVITVTESSNQ